MSNTIMRGVLALVVFGGLMFALATAEAGGTLGTPGNNYSTTQPNHGGGSGFGGCNKDGSFCWSLNIEGNYHNPPTRPYPAQVFGFQAKNLISYGQITQADMDHWGRLYLGVYNNGWYWDCQIDLTSHIAKYRCTAQ